MKTIAEKKHHLNNKNLINHLQKPKKTKFIMEHFLPTIFDNKFLYSSILCQIISPMITIDLL